MRDSPLSLGLILLAVTTLWPSFVAAGFGSCLRAVSALTSRPGEVFDMYQREICDRGCRPTVSHWDLWTRNHTYVPAVRSVTRALQIPDHEEKLIRVGDDAAVMIRENCGAIIEDKNVCFDGETLAAFGNCFKKEFVKVIMRNIFTLLPLVSEDRCRIQYDFVKDEKLWNEVLPNNMREYAANCANLQEPGEAEIEADSTEHAEL